MGVIAKIILDQRRPKRNKTYPLYLRIWFKRSNLSIPLGYYLTPEDWDETNEQI